MLHRLLVAQAHQLGIRDPQIRPAVRMCSTQRDRKSRQRAMHAVSHPARIGLGARKASRQKIADAYRRTLGRNQSPATSDLHVPDAIFCPHLSTLASTGWAACRWQRPRYGSSSAALAWKAEVCPAPLQSVAARPVRGLHLLPRQAAPAPKAAPLGPARARWLEWGLAPSGVWHSEMGSLVAAELPPASRR